ncbi:conserved hypothetical protein, partial [sediment metagenome]
MAHLGHPQAGRIGGAQQGVLTQVGRGTHDEEMQAVHIANAKALAELVAEDGWPGISTVGLEGSRTAWLIAQHAICTPEL